MVTFLNDVRHAIRALARTPGFAVVVILTLALGIGATTALFTLTEALLWRPLPVRDPGQLARIDRVDGQKRELGLSSAFLDLLRDERLFTGLCGFHTPYTTITLDGRMAQRAAHAMTAECFATLGVQPAIGRLFTPADERPGMPFVAVLTYTAWLREYGGRADVLGAPIELGGATFTIIGVAERRFTGLVLGFPPQVLFPIAQIARTSPDLPPGAFPAAMVFARMADGQGLTDVAPRLRTLWPALLTASLPPKSVGPEREAYLGSALLLTSAKTGFDYVLRDRFSKPVIALVGLATIVLLMSLVNVASLLLARAAERRSELSLRLALGAGRWRIARAAAAESVLLIAAGAGAGIGLAYAGDRLLVSILGSMYEDFAMDVAPSARVLGLTSVIAIVTLAAFAVIPAVKTRDIDAGALAAASSRLVSDRHRAQHLFVMAQVALTLTLVIVGTLTAQVLGELRRAPLGFDAERVLIARLAILPADFAADLDPSYQQALLNRAASAPGVESAALSSTTPLFSMAVVEPVSAIAAPDREVRAEQHTVTEDFFATLQIPLVAGRGFSPNDRATDTRRTVIISESFGRSLFDTRDPIGQRIRVGTRADLQSLEIVGVARDAVLAVPQARNTLAVYRNFWQAPSAYRRWSTLVVRAVGDPLALPSTIRQVLAEGGREYPVWTRTLSGQRDAALAQEHLVASFSVAFAAVGLVLAGVGIYGLLSLLVSQRTREIAMRLALGATPGRVRRMILGHVLMLLVAGVAFGMPLAWAAQSAAIRLLGGGGAESAMPVAAAIGLLLTVAIVASWLPVRRASSVDPMVALRTE